MTQEEKLLARLKSLDASSLYEIVVYVTPEKTIGFWIVKKSPDRVEGETTSMPFVTFSELKLQSKT
jgi:hypothetical protein